MGYNLERRTAKLVLHGAYEGAWINVLLDVPMSTSFQMARLARGFQDVPTPDELLAMFDLFTRQFLLEWNLEEKDAPLPATIEGMQTLPLALATEIVRVTLEAVANPPAPLSEPFSNGATSGATALPSLLKPG